MAYDTDYGSTLSFAGSSVGDCKVIDFPELATEMIDTTNHASGGYAEQIPSGLIRVGDITLEVLMEAGMLAAIQAKIVAKTSGAIVVTNEIDTFTGTGYYKSIKEESADAQAPDAVRATVVMSFTGSITISTTA
ncbi:MAG TPA: hypothetical protein VIY48_09680 [Candidatus Paceibacterota bacterium]